MNILSSAQLPPLPVKKGPQKSYAACRHLPALAGSRPHPREGRPAAGKDRFHKIKIEPKPDAKKETAAGRSSLPP